MAAENSLLIPDFENAFWRLERRLRFRDLPGFSKKKGHFEPEELSSSANRWAKELTREQHAEEIKQVYENAVVILGNRRSQMERGEEGLEAPQIRFTMEAVQDREQPAQILQTRKLWIKVGLAELSPHFDDLFPYRFNELVVPFSTQASAREILVLLEDWEERLKGRLEESMDQQTYRLRLKSGFSMSVSLAEQEAVFSKTLVEGVCQLGPTVASELKKLDLKKRLL